jgi:phosphoglycolate phosphatase-like HAD superfamily hydrolase
VLEGDQDAIAESGKEGLVKLVMASHAGMTTDEFAATAKNWLETARHPRFQRPYNELVFKPMLEVLEYLRANRFKTFIVSGGGIEFLRVFAESAYGIPPEQVVGSSIKTGRRFTHPCTTFDPTKDCTRKCAQWHLRNLYRIPTNGG